MQLAQYFLVRVMMDVDVFFKSRWVMSFRSPTLANAVTLPRTAMVLFASWTSLVACAPQNVGTGIGGMDAGGSSGLTAISVGLPDRTPMRAQVADIDTRMNAFHLVIKPVDAACPGATNLDQISEYSATASLNASLRQGCDYTLSLALGSRDATSTTALKETYFKSNTPRAVAKTEIEGRPTVSLDVRVQLQPDGQAIGLRVGPGGNPGGGSVNPNPTPMPGPQLSAAQNISLTSAGGQSKKISDLFKGRYLVVDVSQTGCPPCEDMARTINGDPALQKMLDGEACSSVTLIPGSNLPAWVRAVGGTVATHSYGIATFAAAEQLLGMRVARTPTFAIFDRQGRVVDSAVNGFPAQLRRLCGSN